MRLKLSKLEERESLVHLSYCSRGQRMAADAMAIRCQPALRFNTKHEIAIYDLFMGYFRLSVICIFRRRSLREGVEMHV